MVFLKPLDTLKFEDVENLRINKVSESQILDYKKQLLEDSKLLEEVSAFANTQGGFIIFGVEETGRGGYPKEIIGISKSQINKERMEQVILGNIQPRLNVKIQEIEHQDPSKAIIVVQIPNSYLKPHMHGRYNKFYRRYEFEALPMTEMEVSDAYRRRFAGYQEVESYISKLLEPEEFIMPQIIGQIIVIPTILSHLIETSSTKEFDWMNELDFKPRYYDLSYICSSPTPSPNGIKSQLRDRSENVREALEVHRNGCVHHRCYYGEVYQEKMLFLYHIFCVKLLHTLQFASILYQRYNYFGDVRIKCDLRWVKDSWLPKTGRFSILNMSPCQTNIIDISREFPISLVESKYEYVTSGIMNEIFNNYGLWKCPLFDDEGNLKESMLRS
jgi:hypothetical protein